VRAVILNAIGEPVRVDIVPDPQPVAGGVVVRVVAVRIPSYTEDVFTGALAYDLPTPLVPGPACIGQIEAVADDVFHLHRGDLVLCNSFYSSGDASGQADDILIGWTGNRTERSQRMQRVWRNGSFAEKALYPASCLTVLPGIDAVSDIARLPYLASLAIAYGGWRRGGLRGGQAVVVNGATGGLGGAAVLLALACGAARIAIVGRRQQALDHLAQLDQRVIPVQSSGDRAQDAEAIRQACEGGADLVLDVIAHTPTPDPTLACFDALRPGGTAVLVGGVRHELPIDYQRVQRQQLTITGSFMFNSTTAQEVWQLVRSHAIELTPVTAHTFSLDDFHDGVAAAKDMSGFELAVLLPNGRNSLQRDP
jgi:NADPH:quinone reductase-like Zn-dependent oxidoreductase